MYKRITGSCGIYKRTHIARYKFQRNKYVHTLQHHRVNLHIQPCAVCTVQCAIPSYPLSRLPRPAHLLLIGDQLRSTADLTAAAEPGQRQQAVQQAQTLDGALPDGVVLSEPGEHAPTDVSQGGGGASSAASWAQQTLQTGRRNITQ